MTSITWRYNYKFGNKNRYYGGGVPSGAHDVGLEAFLVAHLNNSRAEIINRMRAMEAEAKNTVTRMSRVDTGAMKSQVFSTGDFGTDILKVRFGWRELAPYYAPFQEFGTRNGITPMRAVHTAYAQALGRLRGIVR